MRLHTLALCIFALFTLGCQGDEGGSSNDTIDCRDSSRMCPQGSECAESANGMFGCVRIMVGQGDAGAAMADGATTPMDGSAGSEDGGDVTPDAGVQPLSCEDLCSRAIDCLYENELCRQLTPGEERDVSAACAMDCENGDIDRDALAGASCEEITVAALTATQDLATLCGIAADGQPCRSADGGQGVCVGAETCTGTADPSKCLGDSVCCVGLSCSGENGQSGACVGQGACDGQPIEGECPGDGVVCCLAFNPAGGACTDGAQCSSGNCSDEASSGRVTPNGFCEVSCEEDADCGDGRVCISSAGAGVCFERCSDEAPCREGWFCTAQRRLLEDEMSESVDVCLTDCRVGGCGREGVCNGETGICELMLEEVPDCPYECAANEECTEERCLRADGSCAGDYNCPLNHECIEGACQTDSFAPCNAASPCSDGQFCVQTQGGDNFCLHTCNADGECPIHMACQALLGPGQPNICYYSWCERNQLNGQCALGNTPNGTCRPLPATSMNPGICLQAGTAANGAECDGEADPRVPEEATLACAPGHLCSGDRDDPLDPSNMNEERGVCRALCEVGRGGGCVDGQACVQIGQPDNPNTMENELFNLGLCYESDCTLLSDDCADGETCQPLSFSANFGQCRPAGEAPLGASCVDNDDCGENTICGNAGSGSICIAFCDFQAQDCPWGQSCVPIGGGAVHACL